jgi:hypothetical protein
MVWRVRQRPVGIWSWFRYPPIDRRDAGGQILAWAVWAQGALNERE